MVKKLAGQIGILGPLAAMFGRDFEQEVMSLTNGVYFSERMISRSVTAARYSIKAANLSEYPNEGAEMKVEENTTQAKSKSRRPGRDSTK